MRPSDVKVSDPVQYTDKLQISGDTEYQILAGTVVNVTDPAKGIVSLHCFLPGGGWKFAENVENTSHPAGEADAVGKWSWPL